MNSSRRVLKHLRRALPVLLLAALLALVGLHRASGQSIDGLGAERWLSYQTGRFRIIYQARDAAAAGEVAMVADTVWERVTGSMDYRPTEVIPVVLYGRTAEANGFFTPFPPHIALYVASPSGPWFGSRTQSWLEAVFVHELTHYLQLTQPTGFFGTISRVLGPLAASAGGLFMPGWTIEGPAVVSETIHTTGGRGRNPFFEMEWVAPILAGEMWSYDQAGHASPRSPRGRIYSAGYIMVDHLTREYGEDAFVRLNREFQRWPFLGMRRALRNTTGVTASDFHADVVADLERRYAWRRTLPAGEALSPPGVADWHLVGWTDRGVVAWKTDPFDRGSLQVVDTAALLSGDGAPGAWEYLAAAALLDEHSVSVTPGGEWAAAVVRRADIAGVGGGPTVSYGDLYLLHLDGSGRSTRITADMRLFHPAIAPDGTIIVAVERMGSYARLVAIDTAVGTITPLYEPRNRTLFTPSFSRDGRFLAVVENAAGRQEILVLEIENGAASIGSILRIGGTDMAPYRPFFVNTADGTDVWFAGDRDGLLSLYRWRVADESGLLTEADPPELITRDRVGVVSGFPIPSSHGVTRSIVYGSYRSDGYNVRIGHFESGDVAGLAPTSGDVAGSPAEIPEVRELRAPGPISENTPDAHGAVLARSRTYRDGLRPVLWFPSAALRAGTDEQSQLDVGASIIAVSTLGRHQLAATALYNSEEVEPSGSITYTYSPGSTALMLGVSRSYEIREQAAIDAGPDEIERETLVTARASRPLLYRADPQRYHAVIGLFGLGYTVEENPDEQSAHLVGSLRLLRSGYSGRSHRFGAPGGELLTQVVYEPAILDRDEVGLDTVTRAVARLAGRGGWMQLAPELAVATSLDGTALEDLPWSGNRFDPEGGGALTTAESALLGRLALRLSSPPVDWARRGLATTGAGLALYVEQSAGLTGVAGETGPGWYPDNYTVTGAEVQVNLFFNLVPIEVTGGVAFRVPHDDDGGDRDMQLYLRLGTPVPTARGGVDQRPTLGNVGGMRPTLGNVRGMRPTSEDVAGDVR